MASMLGCWASNGHEASGCLQLEASLKECMDSQVCYCGIFLCRGEGGGGEKGKRGGRYFGGMKKGGRGGEGQREKE